MTSGEQPQKPDQDPGLVPPGSRSGGAATAGHQNRIIWIALVAVVILGLLVILVLPKLMTPPVPGTQLSATNEAPERGQPLQPSSQSPAITRDDAETALQLFLHTRARLEFANAPIWGDPEWSLAIDTAEEGDRLFGQRQFDMAVDAYTRAVDSLRHLESQREPRLQAVIDAAQTALQADDSVEAIRLFEMALAIEPLNETAESGLQRASVRADVLSLMTTGEQALLLKDLAAAKQAYKQAVTLDAVYEPALAALKNVTQQMTDLAFQQAMSQALAALESRDVIRAEMALNRAAGLKPGQQVVDDLRHQLEQTRKEIWLDEQRQRALDQQHDEDWVAAVKTYRTVLSAVPQSAFAREGLAKAENRAELHRQIDHYLSQPSRLYSQQPLANAEVLMESAGVIPGGEQQLARKLEQLQGLITEAVTPLLVTLQSDGLTSVQIYHVGRLGQFTSHQLELRPGTYTVVGSRPGYRDVRQTFTIKPGPGTPTLLIRCEETV